MELLGKIFDQLTEVHSTIGNVVEDGLGAVALELNIANLHFQAKVVCQHSGTDHGFLLTGNGILPALDVKGTRLAVNLLELLLLRIHAFALHLSANNGTFQSNNAQVMTIGSFHNHQVTGFYALAGGIHVNPFSGILEANLEVIVKLLLGYALESVVHLKLTAALPVFYFAVSRFLVKHYSTSAETVELNSFARVIVHSIYN